MALDSSQMGFFLKTSLCWRKLPCLNLRLFSGSVYSQWLVKIWVEKPPSSSQNISVEPFQLQGFPCGQPKPLSQVHHGSAALFAQSGFPYVSFLRPFFSQLSEYKSQLRFCFPGNSACNQKVIVGRGGYNRSVSGWLQMEFQCWKWKDIDDILEIPNLGIWEDDVAFGRRESSSHHLLRCIVQADCTRNQPLTIFFFFPTGKYHKVPGYWNFRGRFNL